MAVKFGRNYELKIQGDSGSTLTITLPFTIEFDITRNTLTSANVCQIRIYNLSLKNRNQIRRNQSNYGAPYQAVLLRAGYGDDLATIFTGNVSQAWSVREGTNYITQIECFDGGFAFINAKTNTQFPAGVAQKTVIESLVSTLPNVKPGAIGNFPGTLGRGNAYSGNTTSILSEITGGAFFIDVGKANVLNTNEYIEGPTIEISPSSGLLGTPILERTIVRFDMLFEPQLNVGRKVGLTSSSEGNFNGEYKVTAVKHRGMISESVAGKVITMGEFFFDKILTGVS